MIVRSAASADAEAIAAIWNPYIRDTAITFNPAEKTPGQIARDIALRQADGKAFLVAESGGRVIGFATYSQFRGGAGYARTMEHTILLDGAALRRGTGRALMAAVEAHARAGGAHSLLAGVSAENPGGVAFHRATGFAQIAVLPQVGYKFGRWIDLVLLQKFL